MCVCICVCRKKNINVVFPTKGQTFPTHVVDGGGGVRNRQYPDAPYTLDYNLQQVSITCPGKEKREIVILGYNVMHLVRSELFFPFSSSSRWPFLWYFLRLIFITSLVLNTEFSASYKRSLTLFYFYCFIVKASENVRSTVDWNVFKVVFSSIEFIFVALK